MIEGRESGTARGRSEEHRLLLSAISSQQDSAVLVVDARCDGGCRGFLSIQFDSFIQTHSSPVAHVSIGTCLTRVSRPSWQSR